MSDTVAYVFLPSVCDFVRADEMTLEQAREAIAVLGEELGQMRDRWRGECASHEATLADLVQALRRRHA